MGDVIEIIALFFAVLALYFASKSLPANKASGSLLVFTAVMFMFHFLIGFLEISELMYALTGFIVTVTIFATIGYEFLAAKKLAVGGEQEDDLLET